MTRMTTPTAHLDSKERILALGGANDNDADERSVTVAEAALRLGCNATTVRDLVRNQLLLGHRVGKGQNPTGVRIKIWSLKAYEQRFAIGGTTSPTPLQIGGVVKSCRRRNAADDDAAMRLNALGA